LLDGTGLESNYTIASPSFTSITITPRALTVVGATVANKIYDKTTAATLFGGSLLGLASGDSVTLTQAGSFISADVGAYISVTPSFAISGASVANYTLVQPSGLSANITPKALTIASPAAANKTYDGTTAATLSGTGLAGVVSGDSVTLIPAGNFASADIGTGIAVTPAYAISGTSAGNYTLVQPSGLSADITPLPVIASDKPATPVVQTAISAGLLREIMDDHIQSIFSAMSLSPTLNKVKPKKLDDASGGDVPLQSQGGSAACSSAEDGKAASCAEN
jgi:hypothetical protein